MINQSLKMTKCHNQTTILIFCLLQSCPSASSFCQGSTQTAGTGPERSSRWVQHPHRADVSVWWGACVRGYAVFTFGSPAASSGACLISHVPGSGGRWACGLAPQWHFQLNQAAVISPCWLLKRLRHFAAALSDLRAMLAALWTNTREQFELGLLELPSNSSSSSAFSFVGTGACVRAAALLLSCVFVWCMCVCRQIRGTHNLRPVGCRAAAVQPSDLRNRTATSPKSLCLMQVSLGNFTCTISIWTSFQTHSDTTSNSRGREPICGCLML